ncbi:F0F1 ATP synthase subunit alpha [Mesomycoplasma hyorhinis]|uniref:F0F1 ATP synthase subunit alpha n=1 Tax=Mesomycoplasma hyorhinis TaxID=2100 RepID=UPI0011B53EC2|nr:F0F1 ATP synthase subunit alpha [Mesomycoplasma hyorhinis]QEA01596.1 F0F1 ATP synthase subunit alpha [Mesomycoplasma hyorhinis]
MPLKASDISAIIKHQIETYNKKNVIAETGKVITVGDGVAIVYGIDKVKLGELVAFKNNTYGIALNLEKDYVGVVIMGNENAVVEGDEVRRTNLTISTPVGDGMLSRVVNALGEPIDGNGDISFTKRREVFSEAPSIMSRKAIDRPLNTGILAIDSLVPIGLGQRELIIGDRQTGKTAIAIDTILNQKYKNIRCVYVAIGQKNSTIAQIVSKLKKEGAMEYTTVVVASASELAPLQYIAPYVGVSIAEEWMYNGNDVLIIYDDLTKHAIAYRTLSLLLRRPPGREAFPGDIFYQHSYLLERASQLSEERGGGSITALPIVETQAGDISAYIPTNVISITDGQIFMRDSLFNSGQKPAIDVGFSVSRVGSSAQTKAMKQASSSLKLQLAQYNEIKAFAQFGSDLGESSQRLLDRGTKIYELLKQNQYEHLTQFNQVMILLVIKEKLLDSIKPDETNQFRTEFFEFLNKNEFILKQKQYFLDHKALDNKNYDALIQVFQSFIERFTAKSAQ